MKNVLFLFIVNLFCFCNSSAQSYKPFLKDGAHWRMIETQCIGGCDPATFSPSDCYLTNTYNYKLDGDTLVGAISYKKLVRTVHYSGRTGTTYVPCYYLPNGDQFSPCTTVGLLREDTITRKVFLKTINRMQVGCIDTNESLFFDFSALTGDTLILPAYCAPSVYDSLYIVDSIGYSILYHDTLKTWFLRPTIRGGAPFGAGNIKIYESIGASVGLFGYYPSFEGPYETRLDNYCVGTDSVCSFTCRSPLDINEIALHENLISIGPNPTSDILAIHFSTLNSYENLQFILSEITGKELYKIGLYKANTLINISGYSSGLYLWHVLSDGKTLQSGKVLHE